MYAEDETGTEVHDIIEANGIFIIAGNTTDGDPGALKIMCNITDSFIDVSFDAGEQIYYGRLIIGNKSKELKLSGSNKIQISLEPMEVNELELQIDSNDVTYSINGRIAVDNIPPVIDIYGASGNMTTRENKVFSWAIPKRQLLCATVIISLLKKTEVLL